MIRYCFVCLLFFSCVFFVRPDTFTDVAGSGLFIDTTPSGATVFIDGVERGTTPFTVSSMRSGEYTIRITKEGYAERRFNVVIRQDSRLEALLDLEESRGQVVLELHIDTAALTLLTLNPQLSIDGAAFPLPDFTAGPVYQHTYSLRAGWRTITIDAFGWERINRRIFIEEDSIQTLELFLTPAEFNISNAVLRRERFNPYNSGALGRTEINFTVSAPGRGLLELFDPQGVMIYSQALEHFNTWQQQVVWDGRNDSGIIVSDGTYTIKLSTWGEDADEAESTELNIEHSRTVQHSWTVLVDSSLVLRPLSIASASAGVFFAASPETLPIHSFQIEGSFLGGRPLLLEAGKSLPFALGFRISIMDNMEVAAAFNVNPGFSVDTDWGLGASFKWIFSQSMAAELSYGWASYGPYTAFGMGTGLALRLPLMYRILQDKTEAGSIISFDLLLSPYVLWAGEDGYPDSIVPRLGIGGGVLFCYGNISTGLSLRWDYEGDTKTPGPFASALEFKFFPSNFILSVTGGYWYSFAGRHSTDGKNNGFFGGAGLGVMF